MLFLRGFILKSTERSKVLLKIGTRDFQNSPRVERSAYFCVTATEIFENFLKNKTLFKNLERLFMVESAKIEKITFQYKTALWIADVKANRLGSTNWSISKNRTLPVTALFFRNFVSVYEPLVKSWFDVSTTQMTILIVFVSAGVLFERIYSLWVSLMQSSFLIY